MGLFGPSTRDLIEAIKGVRTMAEAAQATATAVNARHDGHERLCTERWEQSKNAAHATAAAVEAVRSALVEQAKERAKESKSLSVKIIFTLLGTVGSLLAGAGAVIFEILKVHWGLPS